MTKRYEYFKPLYTEDNKGKITKDDIDRLTNNLVNTTTNKPLNFYDFSRNSGKANNYKRSNTSKQLGDFTINALSQLPNNFKGIKADKVDALNKYRRGQGITTDKFEPSYVGVMDPTLNQILLNSEHPALDTWDNISHEGNHAINHNNPYITDSVVNFLKKRFPDRPITPEYIPNLYEGIKNIINKESFIKSKTYKANKDAQTKGYNLADLNELLGYPLKKAKDDLTHRFDEVPTHALEAMVVDNHPWQINQQTNPDSRKLLRRLMKDTHQKYMDYGLVNKSQPINEGSEWYNYQGNPTQKYAVPEKYKDINQAFLDKIAALKNPNKIQQYPSPSQQQFSQNQISPLSPQTQAQYNQYVKDYQNDPNTSSLINPLSPKSWQQQNLNQQQIAPSLNWHQQNQSQMPHNQQQNYSQHVFGMPNIQRVSYQQQRDNENAVRLDKKKILI